MANLDEFLPAFRAKAAEYADQDALISMADARWFISSLCQQANVEQPEGDALEYFASELVRLTLEAQESRISRLRLRQFRNAS